MLAQPTNNAHGRENTPALCKQVAKLTRSESRTVHASPSATGRKGSTLGVGGVAYGVGRGLFLSSGCEDDPTGRTAPNAMDTGRAPGTAGRALGRNGRGKGTGAAGRKIPPGRMPLTIGACGFPKLLEGTDRGVEVDLPLLKTGL